MALLVGVDTYATLEEANLYILEYYTSTDPNRLRWEDCTEEDKEVYLRKACKVLDSLPLKGSKLDSSQTLQFPRVIGGYESKGEEIEAQIVQAVYLLDGQKIEGLSKRVELRRQGVRRVQIGNVSESYISSSIDFSSSEVKELLKSWLSGGYSISVSTKGVGFKCG